MTTKLIGLTFALVIGTIVVVNLISMVSDVRQSIASAIGG